MIELKITQQNDQKTKKLNHQIIVALCDYKGWMPKWFNKYATNHMIDKFIAQQNYQRTIKQKT